MLSNWALRMVEPAFTVATPPFPHFKTLCMFSFLTFCRAGDGHRKTLFGTFGDALEPVYELSHARTHAHTIIVICVPFSWN